MRRQNGAATSSFSGGALHSNIPVPDGTADYEVKTTLRLIFTPGVSNGTFVHYLRATTNALSGPAPQGSYYAAELQPTFRLLSEDIGYGFGWNLQLGWVAPVHSEYWSVRHYRYIDSSGAEYRLDWNDNGVWKSREGIYVAYKPAERKLYFPDGTWWDMGAESGGIEPDAGTLYPTLIQDTNGNRIQLGYRPGRQSPFEHSSGRLWHVHDARSNFIGNVIYWFNYSTEALELLTGITGYGSTYTFSYFANTSLNSPFPPYQDFGTTHLLSSVENANAMRHWFTYNMGGELSAANLPFGGRLRWTYTNFTYKGNRTFREIDHRYYRTQPC